MSSTGVTSPGCDCVPPGIGLLNAPAGSPLSTPPGMSRKYLVALRDALPVPDDGVATHLGDDSHVSLFNLLLRNGTPEEIRDVLIKIGEHLVEAPGFPEGLPEDGRALTLALVMVPVRDPFNAGDHLYESLSLVEQTSRAMLRATDSSQRPATSRRLYPWVIVLDRNADGTFEPAGGTVLPDFFKQTEPADAYEVAVHLALDLEGDIMARYEDLWLSARRCNDVDGDFTQAVLAAATATEFLIKQSAWALEWEAAERGEAPVVTPDLLFNSHGPKELIGSVFTQRLGGNWDASSCKHPAGAWRIHVAQVRNQIMHRGARADEKQALLAIMAEERFCGALTEKIMAKRAKWPRTANVLALKGGPEDQTPRDEELATFRAWAAQYGV